MADSIREQILSAVTAAVTAAVAPVAVYRSRQAALATSELPAIIVAPIRDVPEPRGRGRSICWLDWALRVGVDVVVGDRPESSADVLLQQVHAALLTGGRTLGVDGVLTVSAGPVEFVAENEGQWVGVARASFEIEYRTGQADLATTTG